MPVAGATEGAISVRDGENEDGKTYFGESKLWDRFLIPL